MTSQLISDTSGRLNVGRPIVEVSEIDDVIALNNVSTLQWIPTVETGELLIAANGHCASFRYSRQLNDFLHHLAASEKIDISHLSDGRRSPHDDALLEVVSALARWGAL